MRFIVSHGRELAEVVFRDRNRRYGAYVLRTKYHAHLFRALLIVVSGVLVAGMLTMYILRSAPVTDTAGQLAPDMIWHEINIMPEETTGPPEKKEKRSSPEKPASSPGNAAAQGFTVSDAGEHQDTVRQEATGVPDAAPFTDAGTVTGDPPDEGGSGAGGIAQPYSDFQVDAMAVFPGSIRDHVRKLVRYPHEAASEGAQGTVRVRFVVDESGNIINAKVVGEVHPLLDAEALRAVRLLPQFTQPAMVGGRPVKSYYDLPIRFTLR